MAAISIFNIRSIAKRSVAHNMVNGLTKDAKEIVEEVMTDYNIDSSHYNLVYMTVKTMYRSAGLN